MPSSHEAAGIFRAALARLPLVLVLVLAIVTLTSAFVLVCRYHQACRGVNANEPVGRPTTAYADAPAQPQRVETEAALTFFETGGRELTVPLTWDDAWFAEDFHTYNHELARACSVLSSLAYAESGHYQSGTAGPAYMEDALESLGFTEVVTDSYRYRSEVVDQVLNVFTSEEDTVAYALARKRTVVDGEARSVIVVAVRGSYGSEWVSNLYLHDERSVEEGLEGYHHGYVDAASEVYAALAPMVRKSHAAGDAVTVVLTGHSRGGAVANLVASMADDELAGEDVVASADAEITEPIGLAEGDAVTAYTFASPGCTTSADADDARYGNIFNIVNPADMMPSLPLASWGYARYGVDLQLPSVDDEGFDESFERFCVRYSEITAEDEDAADGAGDSAGAEAVGADSAPAFATSPYDPANVHVVQDVVAEVGERVGSVAELTTPGGIATVVQILATHVNPLEILCGHYQSVYVAWMLALDAGDIAP